MATSFKQVGTAGRFYKRRSVVILLLIASACLGIAGIVSLRSLVYADILNTTDFVTTWKTSNPGSSCSSCITIPTFAYSYNYDVDWDNDGAFDQLGITGNVTHDFGAPGEYTIRIRGNFPYIRFAGGGDAEKIVDIKQWGTIQWLSMASAFWGSKHLVVSATDAPDLSQVIAMSYMFAGTENFNQDISHWDVSHITNMSGMFNGAKAFNQDISGWDTSHVTDMSLMFANARAFDQNLGALDMTGVTSAAGMLSGASLSVYNYDNTLEGLSLQNLKHGVAFGATTSTYCLAGTERQTLISTFGWTVSDGGKGCGLSFDGVRNKTTASIGSGLAAGTAIGTLTMATNYPAIRSTMPYALTCSTPGADDGFFSIQDTALAPNTLLDNLNPLDANHDNTYDICVQIIGDDDSIVQEAALKVVVGPIRSITSTTFLIEDDKKSLVVTGTGLMGKDDADFNRALLESLVRLNGVALPFCSDGWGMTATQILQTYLIASTLVSDAPPCYKLVDNNGGVISLTGTQVTIMLPQSFNTEIEGTISINGSNVYVFNEGVMPVEEPGPEEPDTPHVDPPASTGGTTSHRIVRNLVAPQLSPNVTPTIQVDGDKPLGENPTIPNQPTFSGTATPGAEIVILVEPSEKSCTATADASGNWKCMVSGDLAPGIYIVRGTVTNPDGSVQELESYEATVLGVSTSLPEQEAGMSAVQQDESGGNLLVSGSVVLLIGVLFFLLYIWRQKFAR
jgi:surface protein